MSKKKKHQPPMTVPEQIENLKRKGLVIEDEEYACKILNDISYFRLIKAYSLKLKERNGNYNDNVTFKSIVDLYLFNANFRQMLFPLIEKIEVNMRCHVANYFANKYGILEYKNSNYFSDVENHESFIEDIKKEIERNSRSPFVRNFQENYEGGQLPVYALVEIMSFGTLSKFYKNMKNEDKKVVGQEIGVGYTYLQSWLESISYVRNICAHYGRLYNARIIKSPKLYKQYMKEGIKNNKIFGVLLCIKHILRDDKNWIEFIEKFEELVIKHKEVNLETMGFPSNWELLLNDKKSSCG